MTRSRNLCSDNEPQPYPESILLYNLSMKQTILPIKALLILSLGCLLASCSGAPQAYKGDYGEGLPKLSYYSVLTFDSYGMPAFSEKLKRRPTSAGADFYLVEDSSGRPAKYYHININGGNPDMKRPFKTLLDRTVSGIKGGAEFAVDVLGGTQPSSSDETEAVLALAAISVAVGTVGGITVGLVEGTYEAFVEAGKVLSSTEELLSFSLCDYDNKGRLRTLRAFDAGPPAQELFRVRYSYQGGSNKPMRITVEDIRQ